jgi:hypothetical protein
MPWVAFHFPSVQDGVGDTPKARPAPGAATAGRFAPGNRDMPPFDVESTAVDDDLDQLNR